MKKQSFQTRTNPKSLATIYLWLRRETGAPRTVSNLISIALDVLAKSLEEAGAEVPDDVKVVEIMQALGTKDILPEPIQVTIDRTAYDNTLSMLGGSDGEGDKD